MDMVLEMPNLTTTMHTHVDTANEKGIVLYATPGKLSKSNYLYGCGDFERNPAYKGTYKHHNTCLPFSTINHELFFLLNFLDRTWHFIQ